jgi:hypothetical protein
MACAWHCHPWLFARVAMAKNAYQKKMLKNKKSACNLKMLMLY